MRCINIDYIFCNFPGIISYMIFEKPFRIISFFRSFSLEFSPQNSSLFQYYTWQYRWRDVCLLNVIKCLYQFMYTRDIFNSIRFCIDLNIA